MSDKKSGFKRSSYKLPDVRQADDKADRRAEKTAEKATKAEKADKSIVPDDPRPRATIMAATQIAPQLFVGTRDDAEALGERVPDDWVCISVTEYRSRYKRTEELPYEPMGSLDLPFMTDQPNGWHADTHKLDLIAEIISWRLQAGKKVLVHCIQGQERSPLAVAWYLTWSGTLPSMQSAYETVAKLHPRTERRDAWLRGASPTAVPQP